MSDTAKVFMNGRSQAVRLPAAYRFDCNEVYVRRDPETGDVILSRHPGSWEDFFRLVDKAPVPEEFMAERDNEPPTDRAL